MSRPLSARPKTSAGRAASAARRAGAPLTEQTFANGTLPGGLRSASRISMSRAGVPVTPTPSSRSEIGSRIGTSHRFGSSQQRIGSATTERPSTGMARPQTGLNPTIRPVTQQGLSGGRAVSRLSTGSTRQVHDKSYYMGLLRAKLNQLTVEISKLEEVYQKGMHDRMELEAYEQRAKQSAMELKEMQGKLIDYNVIIDNMHTNRDISDIEAEVRRVKESANEVETTVQELFHERQAREGEAEDISMEIEEQKRLNQAVMSGMDQGIRLHYDDCKEKNEILKMQVDEMQEEINHLNEQIDHLEIELSNSPLKRKAVQMQQSIMELEAKRVAILAERETQETPEQKKQKLIEQIRTNNEDIEKMEKQLQKINEQINIAHEDIREFDSSAEEKLAKNNEKYRDLLVKEQEYDEFLKGFEEQKRALTIVLDGYCEEVVRILQKISGNLSQIANIQPTVAVEDNEKVLQGKCTVEELQKIYMRLQKEEKSLDDMEDCLCSEIEMKERGMAEMAEQAEFHCDLDQIAEETKKKSKELQRRRDDLEVVVEGLEKRHSNLQKRMNELQQQLDSNPKYAAYKAQLKKLEMLKEENARRRAEIEKRGKETNYEPVKAEVRRLRMHYNCYLIAKLAKK